MSRARHGKKEHHKEHKASGGVVSKIGNPNVFKMAEGHSVGTIHGESDKPHLGRKHGGSVKHRARGGGCDKEPYSSAKLAKGGEVHKGHHRGR